MRERDELLAAVKECDREKVIKIFDSEMAKERQSCRCQVEKLAEQNKELLKQLEEARLAADGRENMEIETAKWLSEAQEEVDELQAKNNTQERIILNLSMALSHIATK